MRRGALICLASLGLTGCSDATVRRYAALLGEQLRSYQTQLDRNLAAERRLYSELSAAFALEAERDVYGNLAEDRFRASFADARRLEGTTTLFDEQDLMRRQAEKEFDATKEFYLKEMTLPEQATSGLRRLELNTQKVASLAAALDEFTRASGLAEIAGDLDRFKTAFESEQSKQVCRDLAERAAVTKESLANATAEKAGNVKALETKLAQEEALSKACKSK